MMLTVLMISLFYGPTSGPSWDCTLVLLLISLAPSISSPPSRIIHIDKNPESFLVPSILHSSPPKVIVSSFLTSKKKWNRISGTYKGKVLGWSLDLPLYILSRCPFPPPHLRTYLLSLFVSFQYRELKNYPTTSSFFITENGKTTKRCLFSIQRTEKLPNVSFQYRERKNYKTLSFENGKTTTAKKVNLKQQEEE